MEIFHFYQKPCQNYTLNFFVFIGQIVCFKFKRLHLENNLSSVKCSFPPQRRTGWVAEVCRKWLILFPTVKPCNKLPSKISYNNKRERILCQPSYRTGNYLFSLNQHKCASILSLCTTQGRMHNQRKVHLVLSHRSTEDNSISVTHVGGYDINELFRK